ncbi:transposase [Paenibacillus sp. V4I7]|uniref:transposase n=1 Tax=Paenibacillus sp. V4I7 TaxID=3042307 RepID=UPI0027836A46|nr:transposase [Paenibacillus sp. V4I7]MDQ0899435.1 transposase-like protein [Paenibacillus sp. V4I7]
MSKRKCGAAEKLIILNEVSSGQIGFLAAAKKYEINKTTLMKWQRRYKLYGYEGLESRAHNRSYSAELKLGAVKDYLEGGLSQYQIIDKYMIANTKQLYDWIKKYNGHSSLKAYKGEAKAMTMVALQHIKNESILFNTAWHTNIITKRQRGSFRSLTSKCINGSRSSKLAVMRR